MKARIIALLLRLVGLLPLRTSRALGRALGRLMWRLNAAPRRVTERNIGLAFPELDAAQRKALTHQSLEATGELAVEMGYIWNRPWSVVRGHIHEALGEEAVHRAAQSGRGVLLLGPHLGNWEVAGLHLTQFGKAITLYEPPHMQALDAMVRTARQRSGATLVPTDARGLARLVKNLKGGGVAAILPDQVPPIEASGQNSVFMGIPCFTMTLVSKLLARTGAIAFYSFAERTPEGYRMHYIAADDALYSDDLDESLRSLNDGVEACLRICPAQYQWEYKRFRTRPRGPVDYYSPDYRPAEGQQG